MVWAAPPRRPSWSETAWAWAPWAASAAVWRGVCVRFALPASQQFLSACLALYVYSKVAHEVRRRWADRLQREWERKYRLPERDYTMGEIAAFDGSDPDRPIVIAVRGDVFNVSAGAGYYGRDGPYNIFAGKDATWLLAKGELELGTPEAMAKPLTNMEEQELDGWYNHFLFKYERIGRVATPEAEPEAEVGSDAAAAQATTSANSSEPRHPTS